MRSVERKELKYSTINLSVDCLLRSISEEERGEAKREVREGNGHTQAQRHRPMNCGTSFSELMAALKKASPAVVVNGERHTQYSHGATDEWMNG